MFYHFLVERLAARYLTEAPMFVHLWPDNIIVVPGLTNPGAL